LFCGNQYLELSLFFLSLFDIYDEGSFAIDRGYLYVTIIYNVSFTLALYFLFLFYDATKGILARFRPIAKFLCIKSIIFFSYWQSLLIAVLVHFGWLIKSWDGWTVSDVATGLQNFLICVELLFIVIVQGHAFGYQSWKGETFDHDGEEEPTVVQSFVHVVNPSDIFYETFIALKMGPQRHVVVGKFLDFSVEQQKKHVIKQAWLLKRGEDLAKIWKKGIASSLTNLLV